MTTLDPENREQVRAAILAGVKELFSDPKRWCRHAYARNRHGNPVEPKSAEATCFCFLSGFRRVVESIDIPDALRAVPANALLREFELLVPSHSSMMTWNDDHRRVYGDLQALLDKIPS